MFHSIGTPLTGDSNQVKAHGLHLQLNQFGVSITVAKGTVGNYGIVCVCECVNESC